MISSILLVLFYFVAPFLIIVLCKSNNFFHKIGHVVLAYAVGLILGNINVLPMITHSKSIQEYVSFATIPLAIPLLLFSLNIRTGIAMAGSTLKSMLGVILSVSIAVASGYFIYNNGDADFWKTSAMLTGVYTGGTPNLAAIQIALGASSDTFIVLNMFDMLMSSLFLFVYISFGHRLFGRYLKPFKISTSNATQQLLDSEMHLFETTPSIRYIKSYLRAFLVAIIVVCGGVGLSFLLVGELSMMITILAITTFGIVASMYKSINKILYTFDFGMYLVLVFCITVASTADIRNFNIASLHFFGYVVWVITISVILSLIYSKIFKIDNDTMMITSTALILSPPFVPLVAQAINNKQVIIAGLAVGILGYAIGNYLGIGLGYFLSQF